MKVYAIDRTFTPEEIIDILKKVRQLYPKISRIPWDDIIKDVKDEIMNIINSEIEEDPEKYLVPEGAIIFD